MRKTCLKLNVAGSELNKLLYHCVSLEVLFSVALCVCVRVYSGFGCECVLALIEMTGCHDSLCIAEACSCVLKSGRWGREKS